jgi:CheY-like chemotaxis protein
MERIILCVDDEKMILDTLREQLMSAFGGRFGYETAESAEEALELVEELLEEEEVALVLIISDWLMDGMKGDELLVRVHKLTPASVKIMLTGQADESAVEIAREKGGMSACLGKPWNKDELFKLIERSLS